MAIQGQGLIKPALKLLQFKKLRTGFAGLPAPLKVGIGLGAVAFVTLTVKLMSEDDSSLWIWVLVVIASLLIALFLLDRVAKRLERRKNSALGAALEAEGENLAGVTDDELKREREQIREQWSKAVRELNTAGFDLYTFPWFLLVGEPAGGKSTTLQASGLKFPVGAAALSGIGGTRNCDWWFTDEAVILDTAGRFTFEEKNAPDAAGWNEFLGLLQRFRPRCPINGVIVAIPCTSLLSDSTEEIEAKALNIRGKLEELEKRLEIQFPVWVLITKTDKLLGFTEFSGRLPALDQLQLFGWSNSKGLADPIDHDAWPRVFAGLSSSLKKWRQQFLEDDPEALDVDRLHAFPEEFATLEKPLTQYLSTAFAVNRFMDPLFLRGFYFTSGIQKGKPIVTACAKLLRSATGGTDEMDLERLFQKSRAFYIRDFYRKKVFKEQGLVQPTRLALKRRQLVERVGYGSLIGVGLILLMLLIFGDIQVSRQAQRPQKTLEDFFAKTKDYQGSTSTNGLRSAAVVPFNEATACAEAIVRLKEEGLVRGYLRPLFDISKSAAITAKLATSYEQLLCKSVFQHLADHARKAFQVQPDRLDRYELYRQAALDVLELHAGQVTSAKCLDDLFAFLKDLKTRGALESLKDVDLELYARAFTQYWETTDAAGLSALRNLAPAFQQDREGAKEILQRMKNFWRSFAAADRIDLLGAAAGAEAAPLDPDFIMWRTWCEIDALAEGLADLYKDAVLKPPTDAGNFSEARQELLRWTDRVGITGEAAASFIFQGRRLRELLRGVDGLDLAHPRDLKAKLDGRAGHDLTELAKFRGATSEWNIEAEVKQATEELSRAFTESDYALGARTDQAERLIVFGRSDSTDKVKPERLKLDAEFDETVLKPLEEVKRRWESNWALEPASEKEWARFGERLSACQTALDVAGLKPREKLADPIAQFFALTRKVQVGEALRKFHGRYFSKEPAQNELIAELAKDEARMLLGSSGRALTIDSKYHAKVAEQLFDLGARLLRASQSGAHSAEAKLGEESVRSLVSPYFQAYAQAWGTVIDAAAKQLSDPTGTERGAAWIENLEDADVLKHFLEIVRKNIQLADATLPSPEYKDQTLRWISERHSQLQRAYPLATEKSDRVAELSQAYKAHREVVKALTDFGADADAKKALLELCTIATGATESRWQILTRCQDLIVSQNMADPLSQAILKFCGVGTRKVEDSVVQVFSAEWRELGDAHAKRLAGRYPFESTATQVVAREDYVRFYEALEKLNKRFVALMSAAGTPGGASVNNKVPFQVFVSDELSARVRFLRDARGLAIWAALDKAESARERKMLFRFTETGLFDKYTRFGFTLGLKSEDSVAGMLAVQSPLEFGWDFSSNKSAVKLKFISNEKELPWPQADAPEVWNSWLSLARLCYEFGDLTADALETGNIIVTIKLSDAAAAAEGAIGVTRMQFNTGVPFVARPDFADTGWK
ncbi:MAG: type VI secretion protein IcmF/TssM N-terminal domain-containing protein [Planctomycetota bacterium]